MIDDHALVVCAQGGDNDAFAQLYDRHVDAIYRYVLMRTAPQEQVEDITEDVFWRAWQSLSRYQPQRPFRHWLYRIAHNRIVDENRRKAQQNTSLDAISEAGRQLASQDAGPLNVALADEAVTELRAVLSTLTDEEQTLLTLRYTENLAYSDIAGILNKSEGACRVLQHRALKKLAGKLQLEREYVL